MLITTERMGSIMNKEKLKVTIMIPRTTLVMTRMTKMMTKMKLIPTTTMRKKKKIKIILADHAQVVGGEHPCKMTKM